MFHNKIKLTHKQRIAWSGRVFVLPWILGFILFFAKPLIESLIFSFNSITQESEGYMLKFVGVKNYIDAFTTDPDYIRKLFTEIQNVLYEVPIIILFSLFIAVLLNQKFKGRFLARAVFFLPVIITSGIIINILKEDIFAQSIQEGSAQNVYIFRSSGIEEILINSGLPPNIIQYFTVIIDRIFDMTWKSGIQILLFLAGLQTIPVSSYEAARVEGATSWEMFWKITFPLISPVILLNIVYSIIDSFTDYENEVMQMIYDVGIGQIRYGYSAAISWIFFILIFMVIGVVTKLLSKRIFYIVD